MRIVRSTPPKRISGSGKIKLKMHAMAKKEKKTRSKENMLVKGMGYSQEPKYHTDNMEEEKIGETRIFFDKEPTETQVICVKLNVDDEEKIFVRHVLKKNFKDEKRRVRELFLNP